MSIAEDIKLLDQKLGELIIKYDQYFIGLEKREPLALLGEVEKLVRLYAGSTINNTMHRFRFNMLAARLNTYREQWVKTVRLIEEGRYSRERFISDLHRRQQKSAASSRRETPKASPENELDRIVKELREARKACDLPYENITGELVAATINKKKQFLEEKLGAGDYTFRVVVEAGKPKLKAALRKPEKG